MAKSADKQAGPTATLAFVTDDAVPTADGVANKLASLVRLVVKTNPKYASDLSVAEAFKAFSVVQSLPSYWKVLRRRSLVKALAKRIDALQDILILHYRSTAGTKAATSPSLGNTAAAEDSPSDKRDPDDRTDAGIDAASDSDESDSQDAEDPPAAAAASFDMDDIELVLVLGAGGFGVVWLVTRKGHKGFFALKMVRKVSIEEEAQTAREKHILSLLKGVSSAVQLLGSVDDGERDYMLFELAPGGDLTSIINFGYWKWRIPGLGRRCPGIRMRALKVYAAMLVVAVRQMHELNVVHRDIKPDNIIVAANGYLKLADFGLAEVVEPNGTTRTLKGTLKYISPEVAKLCRGLPSPGAGRPSDLWSVGVTLLEMSTGKESPFTVKGADGRTHMGATLDRIIAGKFRESPFTVRGADWNTGVMGATLDKIAAGKFSPPPELSGSFGDLINGLLDTNPETRLGSEGASSRLEDHRFFKGINWDRLAAQQVRAPWRPSGNLIKRLPNVGLPADHPAVKSVEGVAVSMRRSCLGRINHLPGEAETPLPGNRGSRAKSAAQ